MEKFRKYWIFSWLMWGGGQSGNLVKQTPGPGVKGWLVGGGSPVPNFLFVEGLCSGAWSTNPLPWHLMTAVTIGPVTPTFSTPSADPQPFYGRQIWPTGSFSSAGAFQREPKGSGASSAPKQWSSPDTESWFSWSCWRVQRWSGDNTATSPPGQTLRGMPLPSADKL